MRSAFGDAGRTEGQRKAHGSRPGWLRLFAFQEIAMPETRNPDRERKRFFFGVCAAVTVAAFLFLLTLDFQEGDVLEALIDLAVLALMVSGLWSLKRFDADMAVYRSTHSIIGLLLLYSMGIGAGKETVLYWALMMPLLLFFFFGAREGLVWSGLFFGASVLMVFIPELLGTHAYGPFTATRFGLTLFFVGFIGYGLESARDASNRLLDERNQALIREKEQLSEALANIRTLKGLLPICAACKRIRDDRGYWSQLEAYLSEHSDLTFSHGICPECRKKLYPNLDAPEKPSTGGTGSDQNSPTSQ